MDSAFLTVFLGVISFEWMEASSLSAFHAVLTSDVFVDRTGFIEYFWGEKTPLSITVPPKFGKSTIVDMMKRFFEIKADETGKVLPKNSTENYEIFSPKRKLKVHENMTFFEQHFGSHPVVVWDFGQLLVGNRIEFNKTFCNMVIKTFSDFTYLLHSENLDDMDKENFRFYMNRNLVKDEINCMYAGQFLSEMLYMHYKLDSVLIVDGIDVPLSKIMECGDSLSEADATQTITDINDFVHALFKSNEYMRRGFLIGSAQASMEGTYQQRFYSDERVAKYFSLSEEEVEKLSNKFGKNSQDKKAMKEWYGGYLIAGAKQSYYNMYSILEYLKGKELRTYWTAEDRIKPFRRIFLPQYLGDDIYEWFANKSGEINPNSKSKKNPVLRLRSVVEALKSDRDVIQEDKDLFLKHLLELGYLCIQARKSKGKLQVIIPNLEIKNLLRGEIKSTLKTVMYDRNFF